MDIADFLDRKQAENGRKGMSRNEILEIESHAWLCFYHEGEPKDPDGTLVRQEFRGTEPAEWKSDWWRSVNRTPEFLRIREVAA